MMSSANSVSAERQKHLNTTLYKRVLERVNDVSSKEGLGRALPVPVQPECRDLFDSVYAACQKRGAARNLLAFWQTKLDNHDYGAVHALNSIRAPVVQVCKEAQAADTGALAGMTFQHQINEAKKTSLTQMIAIKKEEIACLEQFAAPKRVSERVSVVFDAVVSQPSNDTISPEVIYVLELQELRERVAMTITAIGESAFQRVALDRAKRQEVKRDADAEMTDVSSGISQKKLSALVDQALKRKEQSRKDRTLSGKGKRRAGPPKQQNQKNRVTKGGSKKKGQNKKGGRPTSTKGQQKRP